MSGKGEKYELYDANKFFNYLLYTFLFISVLIVFGCIIYSIIIRLSNYCIKKISNRQKEIQLSSILVINNNKKYDDTLCVICLDDITDKTVELKCVHIYHYDCIKEWIEVKATCPLCNYKIIE